MQASGLGQELPEFKAEIEVDLRGGFGIFVGFAGPVAAVGPSGGLPRAGETAFARAGNGLQLPHRGQIAAFRIHEDAAFERVPGVRPGLVRLAGELVSGDAALAVFRGGKEGGRLQGICLRPGQKAAGALCEYGERPVAEGDARGGRQLLAEVARSRLHGHNARADDIHQIRRVAGGASGVLIKLPAALVEFRAAKQFRRQLPAPHQAVQRVRRASPYGMGGVLVQRQLHKGIKHAPRDFGFYGREASVRIAESGRDGCHGVIGGRRREVVGADADLQNQTPLFRCGDGAPCADSRIQQRQKKHGNTEPKTPMPGRDTHDATSSGMNGDTRARRASEGSGVLALFHFP